MKIHYWEAKAGYPLPIAWKCSRCGSDCYEWHTIQQQSISYFDAANAKAETRKALNQDIEYAYAAIEARVYSRLGLSCSCSKCHHIEPWARMRYKKIDTATLIPLFFSLICATNTDSLVLAIISWSIVAIVAAWFLIIRPINTSIMEKRIKQLPIDSLPRIEEPPIHGATDLLFGRPFNF